MPTYVRRAGVPDLLGEAVLSTDLLTTRFEGYTEEPHQAAVTDHNTRGWGTSMRTRWADTPETLGAVRDGLRRNAGRNAGKSNG